MSCRVFPGIYPSSLSACPPLLYNILKITASVLAAILSLARQDLPSRSNEQIHRAAVQRNVHPCCISFDSAHDKKDANRAMPDRGRVCRGFERQGGEEAAISRSEDRGLRSAPTLEYARSKYFNLSTVFMDTKGEANCGYLGPVMERLSVHRTLQHGAHFRESIKEARWEEKCGAHWREELHGKTTADTIGKGSGRHR